MLAPVLSQVVGADVAVVDASHAVAAALRAALIERNLLSTATSAAAPQLLATDGLARFARVGSTFLGQPLTAAQVQLVDL